MKNSPDLLTASPLEPWLLCKPGERLNVLDAIRWLHLTAGECLSDEELTQLIIADGAPVEQGFGFACFSKGCITFRVPRQDLGEWYPEKGWVAPKKEALARAIATENGLSLCEPPDLAHYSPCSPAEAAIVHHHRALFSPWETIVIAHPRFLKVRLFGRASGEHCGRTGQVALTLRPELMQELAQLYRS